MRVFVGLTAIVLIFSALAHADEFGDFEHDENDAVMETVDEYEDDAVVESVEEDDFQDTNANEGEPLGDQIMDAEYDSEDFENVFGEDFEDEPITNTDLNFVKPDASAMKKTAGPIYMVEYFLAACIGLYVVNYILGRITNGNVAQQWFEGAESFLTSQFALIGDAGEINTESSNTMTREADHIFTLWCSGRTYMEGMLVTLKMIKRQDVFSQLHQKFVQPANDRMIVKINVDRLDPMCLVIGKSSAIREIAENYPDIGYFCGDKIRSGEKFNLSQSILTESADALQLFDKKALQLLNGPVGDALVSLHVSDQFQGTRVPEGEEMEPITKALILVFEMSNINLTSNQCIKFSIYLADCLNKFSLSREGIEKHKKKRQKRIDDANRHHHLIRQEEIAKKNEEKRRDEYQQMIEEEDPDKQKRMKEKIDKKNQKKGIRKAAKMKHMKIRA